MGVTMAKIYPLFNISDIGAIVNPLDVHQFIFGLWPAVKYKKMDEWKSYSFASAMHVVGMGTPRSAKKAWSSSESESAQRMASM